MAQNAAARKKNGTSALSRDLVDLEAPEQLGQLLDAGLARETLALLGREVAVEQLPRAPAGVQPQQRLADPVDVVGGDHDACARLADQVGGRPVRRHRGQDRPLGGEVLEDLAARHDATATRRVREQQQVRLRVALELERAAVRQVIEQLEPIAETERLHPLPIGGAKVADETHDDVVQAGLGEGGQERARVALAEEAPRVRDPEALSGLVLEAGEVVEVGAVGNHAHGAGRVEAAHLVGDRLRDGNDRIGSPGHELDDPLERLLLQAHGGSVEAAIGVAHQRIALVGDPRRSGQSLDRRADQVERKGRAGRDHDVDPLPLDDAHGGGHGGGGPGDARIRQQQAAVGEPRLGEREVGALERVQLLGRKPRARPEVAGPVHERLRRRPQLLVAVEPLRVVWREYVRLDPESRQMGRELERPLHAAAARRGPVHRHQKNFHRSRYRTYRDPE